MSIEIISYELELRRDWDDVVLHARNAIFQFHRSYIEHHEKQFYDQSFCVAVDGRVVAVFPASGSADGHMTSHAGLTFGGLVVRKELRGELVVDLSLALFDSLQARGIKQLTVRSLPAQFQSYPSGEFDYALWLRGGAVVRRDLSSVLTLDRPIEVNKSRTQSIRKARKRSVELTRNVTVEEFHDLVSQVLRSRHGTDPVHSVSELRYLLAAFPGHIEILGARLGAVLVAGLMVYKYGGIWHFQYLATSAEGRECGALDLAIFEICERARGEGIRAISFGTSTTDSGRTLNRGLLWQKESFGARSIVHDFVQLSF